tara:strand:+ start:1028 stop:2359 length:1332 start_codon:yes stop_codon:yes gene_type:complete
LNQVETKHLTKIAFKTLGCKLNFTETEEIAKKFSLDRYKRVDSSEKADIYVFNTCSVTENADKKFKNLVTKTNKLNKNAFIAVIGCYAQLKTNEISKIKGVDLVLGASEKFNLDSFIEKRNKEKISKTYSCSIDSYRDFNSSFSDTNSSRTRSFLKIQDGCDYKCTYCTIPLARGQSRSDSIENIVQNVKKIASNGFKEIVLTGINIGDYGNLNGKLKKKNSGLISLLNELENISGVNRYRISSIEPNLLSDDILKFVSNSKKFLPHFHIPLQSGSDLVLRDMKRRYNSSFYSNLIFKIKKVMPNASIGVDVIVGFPTETQDKFFDTYNFLNNLDVSYFHVFKYSDRENTLSFDIKDKVSDEDKISRSEVLRNLSLKKKNRFYRNNLNKFHNILWESENKRGYIHGLTPNYIKVRQIWDPSLINTIQNKELIGIDNEGFTRVN